MLLLALAEVRQAHRLSRRWLTGRDKGKQGRVLSVDRILADSVHNVFCDESVSAIFEGENQLF